VNVWVAGARPRTLPAAVVPVLVGTAAAASDVGDLGWGKDLIAWRLLAAMVVALAIQVGTNYANDYSDGVKGTDSADRVGPVRLVGSGLASPSSVKRAAIAAFGVAAVAGLALAAAVSWWLILVGQRHRHHCAHPCGRCHRRIVPEGYKARSRAPARS
jgi:1,4-dihydroxy-2-naphthoate octaprenyltransferase